MGRDIVVVELLMNEDSTACDVLGPLGGHPRRCGRRPCRAR